MNKGYLGGYISSDFSESEINCKDGTVMKKIRFSIACGRKSRDKSADFVWVTAIGRNAENILKFFKRGKGILVDYHIQTGSYKNKEGKTVYTEDKIVDSFEFPYISKADEEKAVDNSEPQPTANPQSNEQPQSQAEAPSAPDDSFMSIPDDIDEIGELPFR